MPHTPLRPHPLVVLLTLAALACTAALASEEALALDTADGTLHGTLALPSGDGPFPVAFIHPGSGPTDRDGNSAVVDGDNDSLALLAAALADAGIASLRVDKRGVGESGAALASEDEVRFDTYVDDAVAWLQLLRADRRLGELLLVGHSEGALIALLAAKRELAAGRPVAGYVSLAGAAFPAGQLLRRQLAAQLPPELMTEVGGVIAQLEAGETVPTLPPALAAVPALGEALFRPSVQPYLISWFRYDPTAELAELAELAGLELPVLIVQGGRDLQLERGAAAELAAAAGVEPLLLPTMNHVLKSVPDDLNANLASYGDPDLPLAEALVPALVEFVEGVTR